MSALRAGRAAARGVAFVMVLWLLALLAVLLGAFAILVRTEAMQARHLFDTTQARYAAEAGINRAVLAMSEVDVQRRWVPDGRPYVFEFEGARVEVRLTDEGGKIDLNGADAQLLYNLFLSAGVEEQRALELADAVLDWRDPDDMVMPNGAEDGEYEAAGLSYGSKDAPFDLVSELQQVLGMDYALYQQIEPALTVYTGQGMFNPAFAPVEALRAWPNMPFDQAQTVLDERQAHDPLSGQPPPLMPDGTPIVAQGGSGTYSMNSRATLPNGAWTDVAAVVRLGGAGVSGLAYTVLRWQEGEAL